MFRPGCVVLGGGFARSESYAQKVCTDRNTRAASQGERFRFGNNDNRNREGETGRINDAARCVEHNEDDEVLRALDLAAC